MAASPLIEFLAEDISRADLIALAALGVAAASAIYARRQGIEARAARISAERDARIPHRIEFLRTVEDFCKYCSTYHTLYLAGQTTGTRDLTERLATFEREILRNAINDMPAVLTEAKYLASQAQKLQRHIARLGNQTTVMHRGTEAKEDELLVQSITDEFESRRKKLPELFAPYIHA